MKINTKKIIACALLSLALPVLVMAIDVNIFNQPSGNVPEILDDSGGVGTVVNNVINLIIWPIAVGIVIILFIIAGLKFITAQGEPSKIGEARKMVLWGIIGVIVILISFSIIQIVKWWFEIF